MPNAKAALRVIPGLEVVGRGAFLRPNQPYELKDVLVPRRPAVPYYSAETQLTYGVPAGYEVDDSPPMPAGQALNQSMVEESWDRFQTQTSLDANLAVGMAPFSIDVTAGIMAQVREDEDSYYASRTSFIPLYALYIPRMPSFGLQDFELEIPTPFSHKHREAYAAFFERYGTHCVRRAWVGAKATLVLTIRKSGSITKDEVRAGIKASMAGVGGLGLSMSDQRSREKLQNNSRCTVFGKGGDELLLAGLSTLDDVRYNEWLGTVNQNPQLIELEAVGVWTLLSDRPRAEALMEAYKEETFSPPLRAVFNVDGRIHLFEDTTYYTYDTEMDETSKPRKIKEEWPALFSVGFERVDAVFLGKYLVAPDGQDLGRKLFMFNRDQYLRWDLDTHSIEPGYPRPVAQDWPGVDFGRIDAVVNVDPESLYFFSGNQYVRFNTRTNRADADYPALVSARWEGVTFDRIDAATYWGNGKVYFFRGAEYIRYDTVTRRADPGYPKSVVGHYVQDWKFFE